MLVFASLKSLIPKVDGITTDNWVFRLHCNVTIIFLIAFTIIASSKEYFGNPIECTSSSNGPTTKVINEFCWIESTFSFPSYWDSKVGTEAVYPGIGPNYRIRGVDEDRVFHKYYQWVVVMLCLQAILFYIPRYLWKVWEAGKTKMLLQQLNNPIIEEKEKLSKLELLTTYFVSNLYIHNTYAYKYAFCEVLNFVNVVGQIYMIDKFLGGEFTTYGTNVFKFLQMNQADRVDPMKKVFPRMTKCTIYHYGSSGDIESTQALCVLPLNIINEKIYIFMWVWFCILAVISGIAVAYRAVVMAVPFLRVGVVHMRSQLVSQENISAIVSKLVIGDWFVLYQLSKNMDSSIFREFLQMLHASLQHNNSPNNVAVISNQNPDLKPQQSLQATWT